MTSKSLIEMDREHAEAAGACTEARVALANRRSELAAIPADDKKALRAAKAEVTRAEEVLRSACSVERCFAEKIHSLESAILDAPGRKAELKAAIATIVEMAQWVTPKDKAKFLSRDADWAGLEFGISRDVTLYVRSDMDFEARRSLIRCEISCGSTSRGIAKALAHATVYAAAVQVGAMIEAAALEVAPNGIIHADDEDVTEVQVRREARKATT
jgi:hypothetical protein